jgi:signal peptidase I
MNLDLATILVLFTIISGLIYLFDLLILKPKRKAILAGKVAVEGKDVNQPPFIVDLAISLFPVFLIVLGLRSFLVEPFRIPSASMMPTLLIGDFILVNKFSYGIRLPVINTKIIDIGKPQRGDVVVFRYPEDPSVPYIKRVIGLPGDLVEYNFFTKMLYINKEPITQKIVGRYIGVGAGSNMTGSEQRAEYLPRVEHDILIMPDRVVDFAEVRAWNIPDQQYFVLGDNRDNSRDSRYWGTVPEGNLIGKAFFIWMNWDLANGGISWQRLGTQIQ